MKRNKTLTVYILGAFCAVAALFGALCIYLGAKTEYNPALGYFERDSVFAPALYVTLALCAAAAIAAWVLFARTKAADKPIPQKRNLTVVSFGLIGIVIAADFIEDIVYYFGTVTVKYAYMHYFMWILGAVAAAFMVICAVSGKSNDPKHSIGYFTVPLFLAAKILIVYFDRSVAVNSPVKMLIHVSLICFMLMFTAEAGISLGRGNIFPRWIFTLVISLSIGGACGIGALAVNITGINFPGITVCDAAMITAFALYAALRLLCVNAMETEECVKKADTAEKTDSDNCADSKGEAESNKRT